LDPRDVSAIIVHFRTPDHTVRAARALVETAPGVEVVVVDNASGDRIADRLAREVPGARVLVEKENRGYGAACNRGARESGGRWLLFVNSDAFLQPRCAEKLVRALEEDRTAALAGPRLLNEDGSLQASIQRLPGPWRIFCESSGLAAATGGVGIFSGHARTRQDHSRRRAVEALMGAVLLARRTAFEHVGGFDEAFFLYAEESDLMARLRSRGWGVLFVPDALAIVRTARSKKSDLVVLGTHGRTGFTRLLLGSVASRVVATAPCPVLTVRSDRSRRR
jgi:GT2 family glycosyltransferase